MVSGAESNARVVVGLTESSDSARRTFLALQRAGVDEDDIRLAGDSAQAAQRASDDPRGKERIDQALVRHAARHVVGHASLGGTAGVVVGAAGGALAVLVAGGAWWWVLIPTAVLGVLGAVLGGFVGVERNVGVDDGLELVLTDVSGPMWVAVRVRDDQAAASVPDLLDDEGVEVVEEHVAQTRGLHLIEW
jgi:hypothetical protein